MADFYKSYTKEVSIFMGEKKEKKEKQAWIFKIVLGDPKTSAHLRLKATQPTPGAQVKGEG